MGDNAKYAFVAMQQAVEDSGLTEEQMNSPRVGGVLGQGGTSVQDIAEMGEAVAGQKRVLSRVGPYRVTRTMGSTVSAVLESQHVEVASLRGCAAPHSQLFRREPWALGGSPDSGI